ncbi:hypothetical protein F5I97DRAFT_1476789 [Phlebopus sp. FC_14]|nr:hypothetical protein F5I97DRAFT_1476789 [Phlebopus sp. FC_14]
MCRIISVDFSDKVPLDVSSTFTILVPALAAYFAGAVLAILPRTVLLRRALLPLTLWCALRVGVRLDVSFGNPAKAHANQSLALFMFMIAMRSISWTISRENLKPIPGTAVDSKSSEASRGMLLSNACDLALGVRELDWQGPRKAKSIAQARPAQSRHSFLTNSSLSIVRHLLLADVFVLAVQSFSPTTIGTPDGDSIFDPSLPPAQRYLRSTAISLFFGSALYCMTQAVYDAISVIGVAVLGQRPDQWPPIFHSPWRSTSLRELWGDRWHHLNRRYMIILGAKPMYRLAGYPGGILGAFALSGLFHDFGLRAVGRGSDLIVFGFFFMMGVGVILESLWTRSMRTAVAGAFGWIWTFGWVALWGNGLVDAWVRRGAAAAAIFPEPFRPSKLALSLIVYFTNLSVR